MFNDFTFNLNIDKHILTFILSGLDYTTIY